MAFFKNIFFELKELMSIGDYNQLHFFMYRDYWDLIFNDRLFINELYSISILNLDGKECIENMDEDQRNITLTKIMKSLFNSKKYVYIILKSLTLNDKYHNINDDEKIMFKVSKTIENRLKTILKKQSNSIQSNPFNPCLTKSWKCGFIKTELIINSRKTKRLTNSLNFVNNNDFNKIRRIIIQGESGCGKTTDCKWIINGWITGRIRNKFLLIFHFDCKNQNIKNHNNLFELIWNEYFHNKFDDNDINIELCKFFIYLIVVKMHHRLLLLVDNVEYLNYYCFFKDEIIENRRCKYPIIVWTRIWKSEKIREYYMRVLELKGFNKKSINLYFKKNVKKPFTKLINIDDEDDNITRYNNREAVRRVNDDYPQRQHGRRFFVSRTKSLAKKFYLQNLFTNERCLLKLLRIPRFCSILVFLFKKRNKSKCDLVYVYNEFISLSCGKEYDNGNFLTYERKLSKIVFEQFDKDYISIDKNEFEGALKDFIMKTGQFKEISTRYKKSYRIKFVNNLYKEYLTYKYISDFYKTSIENCERNLFDNEILHYFNDCENIAKRTTVLRFLAKDQETYRYLFSHIYEVFRRNNRETFSKIYSNRMFSYLEENPSYMSALIHPNFSYCYLCMLNLACYLNESPDYEIFKIFILLNNKKITKAHSRLIKNTKNIEIIQLKGPNELERRYECERLEKLFKTDNLQHLSVTNFRIPFKLVSKNFYKNLRSLILFNLNTQFLPKIQCNQLKIEYLSLKGVLINEQLMEIIKMCKKIKILHLRFSTNEKLQTFTKEDGLEIFKIIANKCTNTLEEIKFCQFQLNSEETDELVQIIINLKKLVYLDLFETKIYNKILDILRNLSSYSKENLFTLKLSGIGLENCIYDLWQILMSYENVEILDLSHSKINGKFFNEIAYSTILKLREFDIHETNVKGNTISLIRGKISNYSIREKVTLYHCKEEMIEVLRR